MWCNCLSSLLAFFGVEKKAASLGGSCCTMQVLLLSILFLGTVKLIQLLLGFVNFLSNQFRSVNLKKYGDWAVVTGATDGIGLGYCQSLAKQGLNLVLISRSQDKLDKCASELKALNPKIEVKTISADFSQPQGLYERIQAELASTPVGVLINNVGMSYPHPEFMHLLSDDQIDNLIQLNVISTTEMTRIVVPGMCERKNGCIINVSSAAGIMSIGSPYLAIYSACKAYVDALSRSMHHELKGKGIHVQCQVPYFVTSKLSKIRKTSITTPSPKAYSAAALRATGTGASVVPYPTHAIQHWLLSVLPEWLLSKVVVAQHLGIRKKAYKKIEEKAKEGKTS